MQPSSDDVHRKHHNLSLQLVFPDERADLVLQHYEHYIYRHKRAMNALPGKKQTSLIFSSSIPLSIIRTL